MEKKKSNNLDRTWLDRLATYCYGMQDSIGRHSWFAFALINIAVIVALGVMFWPEPDVSDEQYIKERLQEFPAEKQIRILKDLTMGRSTTLSDDWGTVVYKIVPYSTNKYRTDDLGIYDESGFSVIDNHIVSVLFFSSDNLLINPFSGKELPGLDGVSNIEFKETVSPLLLFTGHHNDYGCDVVFTVNSKYEVTRYYYESKIDNEEFTSLYFDFPKRSVYGVKENDYWNEIGIEDSLYATRLFSDIENMKRYVGSGADNFETLELPWSKGRFAEAESRYFYNRGLVAFIANGDSAFLYNMLSKFSYPTSFNVQTNNPDNVSWLFDPKTKSTAAITNDTLGRGIWFFQSGEKNWFPLNSDALQHLTLGELDEFEKIDDDFFIYDTEWDKHHFHLSKEDKKLSYAGIVVELPEEYSHVYGSDTVTLNYDQKSDRLLLDHSKDTSITDSLEQGFANVRLGEDDDGQMILYAVLGDRFTFVKLTPNGNYKFKGEIIGEPDFSKKIFSVEREPNLLMILVLFTAYIVLFTIAVHLIRDKRKSEDSLLNDWDHHWFSSFKVKIVSLENNLSLLKRRSDMMLVLGIITAMVGLLVYLGVLALSKTNLEERVASDWYNLLEVTRPVLLMLFIETIAFFFLRQYRVIYNEYKDFYAVYLRMQKVAHALDIEDYKKSAPDKADFVDKLIENINHEPISFSQVHTDNSTVDPEFVKLMGELKDVLSKIK